MHSLITIFLPPKRMTNKLKIQISSKRYTLSKPKMVVLQLISRKWIEGWYEWKIKQPWTKCLFIFWRIAELPVILFVATFMPNSRWSKLWQIPVNKFLTSTASYLVFLFIVFLQSNADKSEQLRGPPNTGIQSISWRIGVWKEPIASASTSDLGVLLQCASGFW